MAPKIQKKKQNSPESEEVPNEEPVNFQRRNSQVLVKRSYSISKRSGLVLPVRKVLNSLRKGRYAKIIQKGKKLGRAFVGAIFIFFWILCFRRCDLLHSCDGVCGCWSFGYGISSSNCWQEEAHYSSSLVPGRQKWFRVQRVAKRRDNCWRRSFAKNSFKLVEEGN